MKTGVAAGLAGLAGAAGYLAVSQMGFSTGSRIIDGAIGVGLIGAGYFLDHDGVQVALTGAGVGVVLAAVL